MKFRKTNRALHRDIGYFCSSLILAYCISGIALNHMDDWNPDFIIHRDTIHFNLVLAKDQIKEQEILTLAQQAGHASYKVFDFPTADQVKIYFDQASLHVYLADQWALYESIRRRPVFYQSNVLHRNSVHGWKWASDILAILLITLNLTGVIILKGKYGITGRGKWFILLGLIPPVLVLVLQSL